MKFLFVVFIALVVAIVITVFLQVSQTREVELQETKVVELTISGGVFRQGGEICVSFRRECCL